MSPFDLGGIDIFLTSDASVKRSEHDYKALEKLKTIISDASPDNKTMVTIIKQGAHFPYFNRVPQDAIDTIPESCQFSDISFVDSDRSCVMIQYQTVLKYTVDGFLNLLFELIKEKKFALIYTSDHGQNIYSKHSLPHGSIDNVSECEISVPILLVGDCFYNMQQSENIKSHFQIPATLISIMGFNNPEQYSGSITLKDEWVADFTYLNAPLGENSRWQKASYPCEY
jgi:glucan phosphoethanolaminetransferase (alkaline phosphatase superfamily)